MVFEESSTPRDTPILTRGQYDLPGEVVEPGVPAVAGAMPEGLRRDRLGLAQWMFAEENPLVARVAVNRYWQMLMGEGLASKPDDFGTQSEDPMHKELLDALAIRVPRVEVGRPRVAANDRQLGDLPAIVRSARRRMPRLRRSSHGKSIP